eukprot:264741_1
MSIILISILSVFAVDSSRSIKGIKCDYDSNDFYYRAIAAHKLYVLYYSPDHSNVINDRSLTEIKNIEQKIKTWPGYSNHSLIYKEWHTQMELIVSQLKNQSVYPLYCESPPFSPLNFLFPEYYDMESVYLLTGEGDSFYDKYTEWIGRSFANFDERRNIWFNRETYVSDDNYESPFLTAIYSFGFASRYEWNDDLTLWVHSYDDLLTGVSSEIISISWTYIYDYTEAPIIVNGKKYEYLVTPSPTKSPTTINTPTYSRSSCANAANSCEWMKYGSGYSTCTGESDGAINVIPTITTSTNWSTSAPSINNCGELNWPVFVSKENANNRIYYQDYQWHLFDGRDQYYCNVLIKDVSMCGYHWQNRANGEYAQIIDDILDDNKLSVNCPYVSNYGYSWIAIDGSRYKTFRYGTDKIDGGCNSVITTVTKDNATYKSQTLMCDNNQVFVNFFIGTECEGSAATILPITAASYEPKFSYSCDDSSKCTDYFQFSIINSSYINYNFLKSATECIKPELDDFIDIINFRKVIKLCTPVRDGHSEIYTCNATGGYGWAHQSNNCGDQEPELLLFFPAEGCLTKYNASEEQLYVYGKLTYCGDVNDHGYKLAWWAILLIVIACLICCGFTVFAVCHIKKKKELKEAVVVGGAYSGNSNEITGMVASTPTDGE